jgi:tetratricopeptide (TPR) repeat protein
MQLERRIESAYFQQDAAALQALAATLPADDTAAGAETTHDELQNYYGALLAYRLALLAKGDETRAWPFTQQCVDRLNRALVIDPASAEALALQSACLALQSRLDAWRSPLAAPLSRARIDKALKLAPDNPRVLLLGALADGDRPRFFGGDTQQAFVLMQRAVSAFERQSAPPHGLPAWGAADAFTDLAQDYLMRGEALAARNVLERALLVAPDFAPARHLMAEIVSG